MQSYSSYPVFFPQESKHVLLCNISMLTTVNHCPIYWTHNLSKPYNLSESESLTFCDPMDYTVHGIFQTRILEWVAFPFSRGFPQPRDQTQVSHIAGRFFTSWATRAQFTCLLNMGRHFSKFSETTVSGKMKLR